MNWNPQGTPATAAARIGTASAGASNQRDQKGISGELSAAVRRHTGSGALSRLRLAVLRRTDAAPIASCSPRARGCVCLPPNMPRCHRR